MSLDSKSFLDHAFISLAHALRASPAPRAQWLALDRALGAGLGPHSRSTAGESLLELSARLGAQESCLALLELGADPFDAPQSRDELGQFTRLRGFEALLAANLPEAVRCAARALSPSALSLLGSEWVELSRLTHPLARICRPGGGWVHLCAAAAAPACLELVLRWSPGVHDLDDWDGDPLLSCRGTRPNAVRCANLLVLAGADPERVNRAGVSTQSMLPPFWREAVASSEGALIAMAVSAVPSGQGRRHAL